MKQSDEGVTLVHAQTSRGIVIRDENNSAESEFEILPFSMVEGRVDDVEMAMETAKKVLETIDPGSPGKGGEFRRRWDAGEKFVAVRVPSEFEIFKWWLSQARPTFEISQKDIIQLQEDFSQGAAEVVKKIESGDSKIEQGKAFQLLSLLVEFVQYKERVDGINNFRAWMRKEKGFKKLTDEQEEILVHIYSTLQVIEVPEFSKDELKIKKNMNHLQFCLAANEYMMKLTGSESEKS